MSILSRLFGGGGATAPDPIEYEGFHVFPEPAKEANGYRVGARIEKEVQGALKIHHLIRADTYSDPTAAQEASLVKAKQLIDQQGDKLFD